MSGPYQPPGYPQQPGQWGGGQYEFPTVEYGGLGGKWPEPPRRKRSVGRLVVAVVSVLVIIGGVATGVVLLQKRHHQRPAASPALSEPIGSSAAAPSSAVPADPGLPNGSTDLTLSEGDCVTARVTGDEQYRALAKVPCGSPDSDLVLAVTTPSMAGCADHEYLRLTAPSTGVYCFTLDIRQGDCVDANYLKTSCPAADFRVLATEDGPGSSNSCTATTGATHWVPIGRDPVRVGCLGPPTSS